MDSEVRKITEAALADFVRSGVIVEEISLAAMAAGVEAAHLIAAVEACQVHERAGYFPARSGEYGADVRGRLDQGAKVPAVDYLKAQEAMRRAREETDAALKDVEAIVIPTAAIAAPAMGSERVRVGGVEKPIRSALVDLNRPANLTGLPAISIPCGLTGEGLPVALQFIGRRFDEARLVAIARSFEESVRGWQPRHPPVD
jgi:aspartyl-tRNA(Asn)/glutamyl-tRNA(Gln) amidotransferase subunit A